MASYPILLGLPLLASSSLAQKSELYLSSEFDPKVYVVQGGQVVREFSRTATNDGPAFVVQETIKMFGKEAGDVGREYDDYGTLLSGHYPNSSPFRCLDGTTDGVRNWTIDGDGCTGDVLVGDADWKGMHLAFQATPCSVGIAYDFTDDTLWICDLATVRHYDTLGHLLSDFPVHYISDFGGIALDPADQTLWLWGSIFEYLVQYDRQGQVRQQVDVPGLDTPWLAGMEFAYRPRVTYCMANPNSTGAPAEILAMGSASASAGKLFLAAEPVPDQNGIFFHALNQVQFPLGNGFLCTNGNLVRSAVVKGSDHRATYAYDNSDEQHSLRTFVGTTRNFQYWFRDPAGGGAFFNLSNAVSILIAP